MSERQEQLQDIERRLVTFLGELNDLEKTFSVLKTDATDLYLKVDNELDKQEIQ